MKILPESIKQKIVGRTFIEKYASSDEILMKVMPIIEDYEKSKGKQNSFRVAYSGQAKMKMLLLV